MRRSIKEGYDLGSVKLVLLVTVISDGIDPQKVNMLLADMENSYHGLFMEELGQEGGVFNWQQGSPLR